MTVFKQFSQTLTPCTVGQISIWYTADFSSLKLKPWKICSISNTYLSHCLIGPNGHWLWCSKKQSEVLTAPQSHNIFTFQGIIPQLIIPQRITYSGPCILNLTEKSILTSQKLFPGTWVKEFLKWNSQAGCNGCYTWGYIAHCLWDQYGCGSVVIVTWNYNDINLFYFY